MAWADVPAKLAQWQAMTGYQVNPDGVQSLLNSHGGNGTTLAKITSAAVQADFEAALDYRIAGCTNLAASVAIDPKVLMGGPIR